MQKKITGIAIHSLNCGLTTEIDFQGYQKRIKHDGNKITRKYQRIR